MNKTISLFLFLAVFISSCSDNSLVDVNQEIPNRNWSYTNLIRVPVTINDAGKAYNLYLNLRHTADYKYSNIFVLIHQKGPDRKGKEKTERKEFQLAYPDGEWLGKGSGNLYSYQLLFRENYKFPQKGTYIFEIEQNMRDNPLKEIHDVGLRVEPVK